MCIVPVWERHWVKVQRHDIFYARCFGCPCRYFSFADNKMCAKILCIRCEFRLFTKEEEKKTRLILSINTLLTFDFNFMSVYILTKFSWSDCSLLHFLVRWCVRFILLCFFFSFRIVLVFENFCFALHWPLGRIECERAYLRQKDILWMEFMCKNYQCLSSQRAAAAHCDPCICTRRHLRRHTQRECCICIHVLFFFHSLLHIIRHSFGFYWLRLPLFSKFACAYFSMEFFFSEIICWKV